MERRMKGRTLPFAVFFLFLSLFAFGEKKSYTEVITTGSLLERKSAFGVLRQKKKSSRLTEKLHWKI